MNCSSCNRQIKHAIVMMEDVPGVGPVRKDSCFACVSQVGEREMKTSQAATCPSCGEKSSTMTVQQDSRFTFTCAAGHSWTL